MKKRRKQLNVQYILLATFCIVMVCLALATTGDGFVAMAITTVALPLKNELAERELIKQFRHDNTWLAEIRSIRLANGHVVYRCCMRQVGVVAQLSAHGFELFRLSQDGRNRSAHF